LILYQELRSNQPNNYYYTGDKISQFVILANAGSQAGMVAGSSAA